MSVRFALYGQVIPGNDPSVVMPALIEVQADHPGRETGRLLTRAQTKGGRIAHRVMDALAAEIAAAVDAAGIGGGDYSIEWRRENTDTSESYGRLAVEIRVENLDGLGELAAFVLAVHRATKQVALTWEARLERDDLMREVLA